MSAARAATLGGVGSYLPERLVPNAFFDDRLGLTEDWIESRSGIRARHWLPGGEATSDMAIRAGLAALDAAGLSAQQLDMLILATLTPDRPLPSAASLVQARLGISCPVFDLNAACAGFTYGVSVGASLITSGAADTVLVIGAETVSRILDVDDRGTAILFGDGAGAAVMVPAQEPGVIGSLLGADGGAADLLTIPAGGSASPISPEAIERHDHLVKMPSGREVYKRAVAAMSATCEELLEKSGLTIDDVDLLIPHQANVRIMAAVAERLGIDPARAVMDIEEVGNTSSASIPIALDRAWRHGRVAPGDIVLQVAFGAGLTWGANLIRWTAPAFEDVS